MKNLILFIAAVGIIFLGSSCTSETIKPSNLVTKESKYIEDYNEINVSGAFEVFVTLSPGEESIEIEANENLHDKIKVYKKGNTLYIELENHLNISGDETLRAYITTTSITDYSASGASTIEVLNEINVQDLKVNLTGACDFEADLNVESLDAVLTGASKLNVTGMANTFKGKFTGASDFNNFNFASDMVELNLTGASEVSTTAHKEIKITAKGASKYTYKGNAEVVFQNLTGDSEIIKVD